MKILIVNLFGLIDEKGNLTNAGALLADESPVRHSRLFCTRWNGLTKASGIVDALDDKEYMQEVLLHYCRQERIL